MKPTRSLRSLVLALTLAAVAGCATATSAPPVGEVAPPPLPQPPAGVQVGPVGQAAAPMGPEQAPAPKWEMKTLPSGAKIPPPISFGAPRPEDQSDTITIKGKQYSKQKIYELAQYYRANPWTLGAYVYTFPVDSAGNEYPPDQACSWWFGGEGAMTQTSKYIPQYQGYYDTYESRYIIHVLTLNYRVPDDQVLVLDRCRIYYYSTNWRLPRRWPRWAEWWWGFWIGSGIVLPRPEELPADVQTAYSDYWWLGNYTPTSSGGSNINFVFGPGQNVPISFSFWRYKNHHMYPIIQGNTMGTSIVSNLGFAPK